MCSDPCLDATGAPNVYFTGLPMDDAVNPRDPTPACGIEDFDRASDDQGNSAKFGRMRGTDRLGWIRHPSFDPKLNIPLDGLFRPLTSARYGSTWAERCAWQYLNRSAIASTLPQQRSPGFNPDTLNCRQSAKPFTGMVGAPVNCQFYFFHQRTRWKKAPVSRLCSFWNPSCTASSAAFSTCPPLQCRSSK